MHTVSHTVILSKQYIMHSTQYLIPSPACASFKLSAVALWCLKVTSKACIHIFHTVDSSAFTPHISVNTNLQRSRTRSMTILQIYSVCRFLVWLFLPFTCSPLLVPTERCHYPLPPKARHHPRHFFRWPGKSRPAGGVCSQSQPVTSAPATAC